MLHKMMSPFIFFFIILFCFTPSKKSFAKSDNVYTLAVLDMLPIGVSQVTAQGLSEKIRSRIYWVVNRDIYTSVPNTDKYTVVCVP